MLLQERTASATLEDDEEDLEEDEGEPMNVWTAPRGSFPGAPASSSASRASSSSLATSSPTKRTSSADDCA